MNANELTVSIKSLAGASTADLVGIASRSAFTAEELGELGEKFGTIRSIVVLALHIVDPIQTVRFYSGQVYRDSAIAVFFGDAMLRHTCWQVAEILRQAGFQAAIPRNLRYGGEGPTHKVSYKKAAVLAGLGALGNNQLLIHPDWGPWLYLRTVVTDAPLPPDAPISFSPPCDDCGRCFDACPCGALSAVGIDRKVCAERVGYREGRGPTVLRLSPHGQINCEECMRACPIGTAPPRLEVQHSTR